MKTVEIENLKDIKKMKLIIPDEKGVYLIAGSNGCGKTTLLVCLDRICNAYAFSNGLNKTSSWNAADQYENAIIKYTVEENKVEYKKKKAKWAPTPRKNSQMILNKFGFSKSVFIRADSRRIDVKSEDIRAGNLTSVDMDVKKTLNQIFETIKYDKLQRLKNTNGRGKNSIFFYVLKEGSGVNAKYYSEKRFSTGELAMVRLIEQVESVGNGAMILLDEAELALHPRVQVKLLEYLRKKAIEKNLWVFISTHSPTMLKASRKEEILLLRKEEIETKIITPCYPAQAIGDVDFATSNIFDYIFFVEDEKAQTILRYMRERYVLEVHEHSTALCNIIPVGGFYETARLAVLTYKRLFGNSKVFAIVDQDAIEEIDTKPKFKELYNQNKERIKTLSFTPEVWIIEKMEAADNNFKRKIVDKYYIELNDILESEAYKNCKSSNPRQAAKDKFRVFIDYLWQSSSGIAKTIIENEIIKLVIDQIPIGEVKKVMNPLFRD